MRLFYGTLVILFLVAVAKSNTLREFRIGGFNIGLRGKTLQKCQNNLLSSLKQNQRKKCERYQRTLDAMNKGIAMALAECKNALTNHAWNCSGLNTSQILQHQGILQTDTRESAFVNALTSAAVLYKLAEGCVNGIWGNCSPSIKDKLNPKNRKKDCCLNYVERISKKLLNPKSSDLRSFVISQNNRAGRKAIWTNMKTTCRIYQTRPVLLKRCWHILPNFKEVAEYLLRKKQSRKVRFDKNTTILVKTASKKSKIKTSDLVHTDKSPNFCRPDPTLGILGTQGRMCSENSGEDNYCGTFCCDGYKTTKTLATQKCNYRFVFCCRVEYQYCNYTLVEHRCNGEQQQQDQLV